jgi:hypothetical protein
MHLYIIYIYIYIYTYKGERQVRHLKEFVPMGGILLDTTNCCWKLVSPSAVSEFKFRLFHTC